MQFGTVSQMACLPASTLHCQCSSGSDSVHGLARHRHHPVASLAFFIGGQSPEAIVIFQFLFLSYYGLYPSLIWLIFALLLSYTIQTPAQAI